MKKIVFLLLPQVVMAASVGTNIKMEGVKPVVEINIQPHKNVYLNSKFNQNLFEQSVEIRHDLNEHFKITGEAFVGYEKIKEDNTEAGLKKYKTLKADLEKAKNDITAEEDASKIVKIAKTFGEEKDIQDVVKDKITRKDAYKKLLTVLEKKDPVKLKVAIGKLQDAIKAENLSEEKDSIGLVMNDLKTNYNDTNTAIGEGTVALAQAYNGHIDNDKVKTAFSKFSEFFNATDGFATVKDDFSAVSSLYENYAQLKTDVTTKVDAAITNATQEITKIEAGTSSFVVDRSHTYYGVGIGTIFTYDNLEFKLKGRLGQSNYVSMIANKTETEKVAYWSVETGLKYNYTINNITLFPEIGMRYVGTKYGQKGFIPYGSVGLKYTF